MYGFSQGSQFKAISTTIEVVWLPKVDASWNCGINEAVRPRLIYHMKGGRPRPPSI
jgi:hypothetical protein